MGLGKYGLGLDIGSIMNVGIDCYLKGQALEETTQ